MPKAPRLRRPVVLTDLFWNTLYRKWRSRPDELKPAYTILLPVPGDLPVFLKLALHVCAAQRMRNRSETLVIPDKPSAAFERVYESCCRTWREEPMRLITLPWFDAMVTRSLNNPSKNHWLQLVAGIAESTSTHVLLHDADLFVDEPDFIESHYQRCVDENLDCIGVSKVWDPWYDAHGYDYLAATWEMIARVDWLRKFPPALHRGHFGVIDGEKHVFDTTLKAQCMTPRHRVGRQEREFGFVHFNYVISTYRAFQNRKGTFCDDDHRILLIRLLIDAFDESDWAYDVPALASLVDGITNELTAVTCATEKARISYPGFRRKLEELLQSALLSEAQVTGMRVSIEPFDAAFDWRDESLSAAATRLGR
jgi:hypothetical protein